MSGFYVQSTAKPEKLQDGPFKEVMGPLANCLRDQGYAKLTRVRCFTNPPTSCFP